MGLGRISIDKVKKTMNKNELIDRYIFRVWKDDENDFIAACAEFPSMSGFGPIRSAALDALQDALGTAIQWMEEEGEDIPVPHQLREYKGNISLRTTPEKHRELAVRSAKAGVSLNRYINSRL